MKIERHIDIVEDLCGTASIDLLKQSTNLSKSSLKQAMYKGAVWLSRGKSTQRLRRADRKLMNGDVLHLYYDENILNEAPSSAVLIADEGAYSIWNKPYGMLCLGSKWGDHFTINRWVEAHITPQRPAFIVHRLDRAASGLIIIAHKKETAAYFSRLFEQRDVEKYYQATVHGHITHSHTLDSNIDGKIAVSHVKPISYDSVNEQTCVQVRIETGRKHQIRRHLAESGFPIVGDRMHGQMDLAGSDSQDLRLVSCFLAFRSPIDSTRREYTLLHN